jgi:hypothetical protein
MAGTLDLAAARHYCDRTGTGPDGSAFSFSIPEQPPPLPPFFVIKPLRER